MSFNYFSPSISSLINHIENEIKVAPGCIICCICLPAFFLLVFRTLFFLFTFVVLLKSFQMGFKATFPAYVTFLITLHIKSSLCGHEIAFRVLLHIQGGTAKTVELQPGRIYFTPPSLNFRLKLF